MNVPVYKYQGAGNDFVLCDNRSGGMQLSQPQIAWICNRHFGVGADGLMLLETASDADFRMVYFNADGKESTMCGNGGRCITAFAARLGVISTHAKFRAIDGLHEAEILPDGLVALQMHDVDTIETMAGGAYVLNTGSPHYVVLMEDITGIDAVNIGRSVRYAEPFVSQGGVNVNLAQRTHSGLIVRTYERGVEDETLSCGTGVVASAIALTETVGPHDVIVKTKGGVLRVLFQRVNAQRVQDVKLIGPAVRVFDTIVDVPATD